MQSSSQAEADLTPARTVGFAFGDFGLNLYWQSLTLYLLFYYTEVVGLSPAIAGLLYMLASFWDGLIDPLIGAGADRTRSRWGGYRPYLLFGAPLLAASFALLYFRPPLEGALLVGYVFVTHLLFRSCYAGVSIPYAALTARITTSASARSQVAGLRMMFGTLATMVVALATQPVANAIGGDNGYAAAAGIFAAAATVILLITFAATREISPPTHAGPPTTTGAFWASLLRNRAFWTLIGGACCMIICATALGKSVLYYFKYKLEAESQARVALAVLGGSGLIVLPLWMWLARYLGKRGVWFAGCAVGAAGLLAFAAIDVRSPWLMTALLALINVGTLGLAFSFWAMLPDCVEYGEWRTGVRAEAFIFGLGGFFAKMAMGLGAGLFGLGLSLIGYHPNHPQTPETLERLKLLMVALPLAGYALGALCMAFSPFRRGAYEVILKGLADQRRLATAQ